MPGGRVRVTRLFVRGFRNLAHVEMEPASRFNLIHGDNGHGKTSLIEALYVLCTTKSFRSQKLSETVLQGEKQAEVSGRVETLGLGRKLRAVIGPRSHSFALDDKRPKRRLDYALETPVIAFHPGDLLLASGPAQTRRSLLDRVMLYQDPGGAEARLSYQKALRDRQKILTERGTRAIELGAYESVAARYGARFCRGRAYAAQALIAACAPAFSEMAPASLVFDPRYEPGGALDEERFEKELHAHRGKDFHRGAAGFGPQRDELSLYLDGRAARSHASQGQQRLLTLALKLAELACVREVTGKEPMLLLDDVSSELDPERTRAVFDLLGKSKSQIFVTTTRPELFSEVHLNGQERMDFEVRNGALEKSQK